MNHTVLTACHRQANDPPAHQIHPLLRRQVGEGTAEHDDIRPWQGELESLLDMPLAVRDSRSWSTRMLTAKFDILAAEVNRSRRRFMDIEADVEDDGTVTIQVPKRYRGKRVRVSIQEVDEQATSAQWRKLSEVLDGLDQLGTHRYSHLQIIDELRRFREGP